MCDFLVLDSYALYVRMYINQLIKERKEKENSLVRFMGQKVAGDEPRGPLSET